MSDAERCEGHTACSESLQAWRRSWAGSIERFTSAQFRAQ